MPKQKRTQRSEARGIGRPPLAKAQKREKKVLASFTRDQYETLESDADEDGLTVSELVAQRALGTR